MTFNDITFLDDDVIVGFDEAGRGPVLGPMIIAAVSITAKNMSKIIDCGVKDSKQLSKVQREKIFREIRPFIEWKIKVCQPQSIDHAVKTIGLNTYEMNCIAELAKQIPAQYIIADSPYNPKSNFNFSSFMYSQGIRAKCFAENKADALYPIVSAASVVAKEAREKSMQQMREYFGIDFGSGYPFDPATKLFLSQYWSDEIYAKLIRKTWETYRRLENA